MDVSQHTISFINGISDKSLCAAYGFPVDMDETIARKIFDRFEIPD